MNTLVHYNLQNNIATRRIDDGKRNALSSAVLRHRLVPSAFQRAVALSQTFDPESALQAGFFDELADPAELMLRAEARMNDAMLLDQRAHTVSKRRIRKALIRKLRSSVPLDLLDAALIGLRRKSQ